MRSRHHRWPTRASVSPAPGYIVSNTGQLSFPYIGSLKVAGMTLQEMEGAVVKRLARVFRDPQISVRVEAFRSKRAYMDGEVRTPGLVLFTRHSDDARGGDQPRRRPEFER